MMRKVIIFGIVLLNINIFIEVEIYIVFINGFVVFVRNWLYMWVMVNSL